MHDVYHDRIVALAQEIQSFLNHPKRSNFDNLAALLVLAGAVTEEAVYLAPGPVPPCVHDLMLSIRAVLSILREGDDEIVH